MRQTLTFMLLSTMLMGLHLGLMCRDEHFKPVDWFIALRMNSGTTNKRIYLVLTNLNKSWYFADETELMVPLLNQVDFAKHKGAVWNDQPPGITVSETFAHDKGMFFFNPTDKTGFHITHSVPLFPNILGDKIDPVTNLASDYGQSFICISVRTKANTVMQQIYSNLVSSKVYFYKDNTGFTQAQKSSLNGSLGQRLKDALGKAVEGNYSEALELAMGMDNTRVTKSASNRMFKGVQGLEPLLLQIPDSPFTMITKPSKHEVNVFSEFLIPGLHSTYPTLPSNFGLAVESWSRPSLPSVCQHSEAGRKVVNIKRVQYGLIGQKVTQDHSKWAIGVDGGEGILCIGGMNNMAS